ncbi:MAG TPA: hypothetical protein VF733_02065 [Candidatus Saccharimonadales bacterium]
MNLRQLDQWHKTRPGLMVFGLIELVLAYLFGLLATDSGSVWQWILTFILLFAGLANLIRIALLSKK